MIKNKKANVGVFGFFFVLMIFSSIFLFISFGMHYLLYDYAIVQTYETADIILDSEGQSMTNIEELMSSYLGITDYYDLLFLFLLISAFVESTIAAIRTKEQGFLSFFGLVTIGNVFLIFILSYATQIQGWIVNEVLFEIIIMTTDTPVLTFFLNYSIFIGVFWYLWLLGINQINIDGLKERFNTMFSRATNKLNDEGRFEE